MHGLFHTGRYLDETDNLKARCVILDKNSLTKRRVSAQKPATYGSETIKGMLERRPKDPELRRRSRWLCGLYRIGGKQMHCRMP